MGDHNPFNQVSSDLKMYPLKNNSVAKVWKRARAIATGSFGLNPPLLPNPISIPTPTEMNTHFTDKFQPNAERGCRFANQGMARAAITISPLLR